MLSRDPEWLKYAAPGDIRLWQKHHCQPQIKADSQPLSRRSSLETPSVLTPDSHEVKKMCNGLEAV